MSAKTFIIYARIGRYWDAVLRNVEATKSDQAFAEHGRLPYGPAHNMAFLIYAANMAANKTAAVEYSELLRTSLYMKYPDRPDGPGPSVGWHIPETTELRFGNWPAVLDANFSMPRSWPYGFVLGAFARGIAAVRSGMLTLASEQLQMLQLHANNVSADYLGCVQVADLSLKAAIADVTVGLEEAIPILSEAVVKQVSFVYDEPPKWFMPMRQCLGTLQRRAGHLVDAKATFINDLSKYPENPWSLYGLLQVERLQKVDPKVLKRLETRLAQATKHADRPLESPCPMFESKALPS